MMQNNTTTKPLNQNKMKITIEHYENKITHEVNDDVTLDRMLEIMECLLKAVGYRFNGSLEIVNNK